MPPSLSYNSGMTEVMPMRSNCQQCRDSPHIIMIVTKVSASRSSHYHNLWPLGDQLQWGLVGRAAVVEF